MDLVQLRNQIDKIDSELISLFCTRMNISAQVAQFKKENGLPIYVPTREQEILDMATKQAGSEMSDYVQSLYRKIFELSREYQQQNNTK